MIDIKDLSLLKITKVKNWAIYFDYDGKHYFIHGNYEIGEGSWQELYERDLNYYGQYSLKRIKGNCSTDRVASDYISKQKGKTIVYSQIDKKHFAYKLTKRGFATGIMEHLVKSEQNKIQKVEAQIQKYRDKIHELEKSIAHLR